MKQFRCIELDSGPYINWGNFFQVDNVYKESETTLVIPKDNLRLIDDFGRAWFVPKDKFEEVI